MLENQDSSSFCGHLEDKFVCDIQGKFFVARYQRGYRWTEPEVLSLLNDLKDNIGKPYCLQPLVVKSRGNDKSLCEWELVDGQQRMTTLYLLLSYLKKSQLKPLVEPTFSLDYETRPDSEKYLKNLDPKLRHKYIDFDHIFGAYECIEKWFEAMPPPRRTIVADDIYKSLVQSVRVIWYEAPADMEATKLFTRLNVGKIPLDDAELFKALLLSAVSGSGGSADRATEISSQWDTFERDLRDPDVWAFVSDQPEETSHTRLTLLLEILAGKSVVNAPGSYRVFDALRTRIQSYGAQYVWEEVVGLHATVIGWYREHNMYHKIGYLIAVGHPLSDIMGLARAGTKRQFEVKLDGCIRDVFDLTPSEVANLSYEHPGDWDKAERLLLLMNVESVRRNVHSLERYPFRSHKAQYWSLEHIDAQHAQALNKVEQWREWISLHVEVLRGMSVSDNVRQASREAILMEAASLSKEINGAMFNNFAARVQAFFTLAEDREKSAMHSLHSISNLALLPSGVNSALSNAVFEVKRQKIIEMDRRGEYIPICTRHVFLKYFTGANAQQVHFWSIRDRKSYLDAMIAAGDGINPATEGAIRLYLKPEEQSS